MTDDDPSGLRAEPRDPKEMAPDPDLSDDLGYELVDLDVIHAGNHRDEVLIMPKDEEMLHDNMFMVADDDSIVDLIDRV